MRVLFSCTSGYGHFLPLLPLAHAFADDGHEVAFATGEARRAEVERAGFAFLPAGVNVADVADAFAQLRAELRALPIGERRVVAFARRFAVLDAPHKLEPLLEGATEWRPDLVVHESADLAAPIVTRLLDLREVHHGWGRVVPLPCWESAAEAVAPLWRKAGLEPEPLCGKFRSVYVDICPPSLQTSAFPPGAQVELMQPAPPPTDEGPPEWLRTLPRRPTVYVTLGTVVNEPALFRLVLDALADEDCNVIATVGMDTDLAALEPVPPNAVVRGFVPQALLLPQCDVVVAHGGSGSTLAALVHGLPSLLLPAAADQFENAGRCAELGVARVLLPDAVARDAVREAVRALLADGAYAERARAVAAEIAAMPVPSAVVSGLIAAATAH